MITHLTEESAMNSREYVQRKLEHLKRIGVKADINPKTGGVRTEWTKAHAEEMEKRVGKPRG